MTLKKIAISMRVDRSSHGELRDGLSQDLVYYFSNLGYELLPIPNVGPLPSLLLKTEGILLSGGNDISPALYGQTGFSPANAPERDQREIELLHYAIATHKPVLGICRGLQMINVFFGGSLLQSLVSLGHTINHVANQHSIKILEDASHYIGKTDSQFTVNSFHQQGFTCAEMAKPLKALAIADDGIVEAAVHSNFPILGIMWHPERPGGEQDISFKLIQKIFGTPS